MTKLLHIAIGLSSLLTVAGCYNTSSVKNGGLACGSDSSCPVGYTCLGDKHCWKNGTGPVDPGTCTAPLGPVAGCSAQVPPTSECDPVCQSGCGCNRCVLASSATEFVCETTTTTSFVPPLGTCSDAGSCAPGSVCIADDVCPNLCYKTCRSSSDCGVGTQCTKTGLTDASGKALVDGIYFCSPPTEACNPTGTASCLTARAGFSCVFLAGLTGVGTSDATVCDCATLHSVKAGAACSNTPDNCQPGTVCVSGTCRTICAQSGSGSACPSGGGCTPLFNSKQYGYCR